VQSQKRSMTQLATLEYADVYQCINPGLLQGKRISLTSSPNERKSL
jgi:hypothetical protein